MGDRPADRDVRISVRTTYDTKYRMVRAAAHHGLDLSTFMKLCTLRFMYDTGLWTLPGRVNDKGRDERPRWTQLHETHDPDRRGNDES